MTDDNGGENRKGYPEDREREVAAAGGRAAFGVIPYVGAGLGELWTFVVMAPLVRRRDEWGRQLEERLKRLEAERGVPLEDLRDSEEFITVVTRASQTAIRDHQEEKHEALRAAVTNAAIGAAPDIDLQLMFLRWVDDLTVTHLTLLRFLDDPPAFVTSQGTTYSPAISSSLAGALEAAWPQLAAQRELYELVANELTARGLVDSPGFHTMMSGRGWEARRTKALGHSFIEYITDPLPVEDAPSDADRTPAEPPTSTDVR